MVSQAGDGWHFVGKHAVRFEEPDGLFSRPDGDMSVDEMLAVTRYIASLPQPAGGFFVLIDAGKGGRLDPSAMKLPEVQAVNRSQRAVAYLNARYYQRTLVSVFLRAAKLLKLSIADTPIGFFDTEPEARAWLVSQRSTRS